MRVPSTGTSRGSVKRPATGRVAPRYGGGLGGKGPATALGVDEAVPDGAGGETHAMRSAVTARAASAARSWWTRAAERRESMDVDMGAR